MSDYLDPTNGELLKDFFAEAQLQVDALERNILVLENDPGNHDAVDEIFRAAHTLKGGSATVEMTELAVFTHLLEDVLDEIRSGSLKASGTVVDSLLASIDVIKSMLDARMTDAVFKGDISALENSLRSYLKEDEPVVLSTVPEMRKPVAEKTPSSVASTLTLSEYEILELVTAAGGRTVYQLIAFLDEKNPMNTVGGIHVFALLKRMGLILKTVPDFEKLYEDVFYPRVEYYIASNESVETLRDKVSLPDVTVNVEIQVVHAAGQSKPVVQPVVREAKPTPVAAVPEPVRTQAPEPVRQTPVATAPTVPADAPSVTDRETEDSSKAGREGEQKGTASVNSVLRVDSRRIDNLLNLVSETVINKATFNQIITQFGHDMHLLQNTESAHREKMKALFDSLPDYLESMQNGGTVKQVKKDLLEKYGDLLSLFDPFEAQFKASVAKFRSTAQNLGRITGELQEGVMKIRMVPISQIFSRFPRLVRDLSKSLDKKIALRIEGEDTELDKSVIEDLLDPLIHCVRNSIDHGIESPARRLAAGKPSEGILGLRAGNEGNMIIIEITDDGNGIDMEAVRQRAVERGIIHPGKNLTDIEAYNLIFEPGFSTAKTVTNISGRGVGLDVVRKQIEKLNGSVSVVSERGSGTKFVIKLPLTLAIIQGLLVKVGGEIYAIPISSVIESHRIKPSEIRMIDNYEVFNVRDDVISLIRLNRLFKIRIKEKQDYTFVVIVGSNEKKIGLMVDSLIGEEDLVIKPLKDQYTNSPGIAGATILGDGTVSLIIDVSQLLSLGLKHEIEERRRREAGITTGRR